MKIDLDEFERLDQEADERHKKEWLGGPYHYMHESEDTLAQNGFIYTLARDLRCLQSFEDYQYAVACMNAIPHLIKELRAAREVVEAARELRQVYYKLKEMNDYNGEISMQQLFARLQTHYDALGANFIKISKYDEACK